MAELPFFCPNLTCRNHHPPGNEDWYRPNGWYQTKAHGVVKRYVCRCCGKSFSEQTFRLSYYLHLNIDFKDVLYRLSACSGIRAMARFYQVTDKVIANRIGRLARQAIGLMAELRCSQDCAEELAVAGFESYIRSHYSSTNIHFLIGMESQYIHACDFAFLRRDFVHLRRKGRMSDGQKRTRELLEQGDPNVPGEVYASFERICQTIDDLAGSRACIVLHTDEKKEYRAVLEANQYLGGRLTQRTASSCDQAWAIIYLDREIRKDQAAHVRKTTRWSQEANNCMERLYAYAGYHNFFKPFRIKERDNRLHAEMAGYAPGRIKSQLQTFFSRRYFFSKVPFTVSEWFVWLRAYRTPFRSHALYLPGYVTEKERLVPQPRAA